MTTNAIYRHRGSFTLARWNGDALIDLSDGWIIDLEDQAEWQLWDDSDS